MARPKAESRDTRSRILAAASEEFGSLGFAATTVDRIARRAHVNKAMIYYHFPSKRALYTCIIRDLFTPMTERLRAAADENAPPDRKLARLIDALVRSVDQSTHFLPIFLREIADGGARLGPDELALISGVFAAISGVVIEGATQKVFQPIHPALAHFTLVAPLVMFRATAPVRVRLNAMQGVEIPDADSDTLVRHLQMVAQRMLAPVDAGQREGPLDGQKADRRERSDGRGQRESRGQR